jgi:excisionase family DNA binding protein
VEFNLHPRNSYDKRFMMKKSDLSKDLLTTQEAANELNVSDARVRQLIYTNRLPAHKFGTVHIIKREDLELVRNRRNGRPASTKKAA